MKCCVCKREIKENKKYWIADNGECFCSKVCIANRAINYFELEVQE